MKIEIKGKSVNKQFYLVGGTEALNDSLAASISINGWNPTTECANADLLIVNLEPEPKTGLDHLWQIIQKGVEGAASRFDYIIMFSSIDEEELHNEFGDELWNKFRFIRKSCASLYFNQFEKNPCTFFHAVELACGHISINRDEDDTNDKRKLNYIERLSRILEHARNQGWQWAAKPTDGLFSLASTKDNHEKRLDDEHDVETQVYIKKRGNSTLTLDESIGKILAKQAIIDYYYLATAVDRNFPQRRTIVCIDDKPSLFKDELVLISQITGDLIYYTSDVNPDDSAENAEICITSMKSSSPSLAGKFCLAGDNSQIKSGNEIDPDWILMDLLLKLPSIKSTSIRLGDDALKRYLERSPGTPSILLTWSEEPDVAAGALRESKACSVVSKRRILRLPYEMENYRKKELGEVLNCFKNSGLVRRLTHVIRLWTSYPGILWHGEKTYHAAEHTLEHHRSLWRLVNQLMPIAWAHMIKTGQEYKEEHLFRFLIAIWLHDIGSKGNETYQTADQVRNRHSWISGALIHRNPELYQLVRGEEADIIELLCAYHQSCAPFDGDDIAKAKEDVVGLFQQSLEQIEKASNWKLMGWAALLRLLDAMDHNWQRVGIKQLVDVKKVSIEMDRSYYKDRAKISTEAETYAKWLGYQNQHMAKHLSVLEVNIRTELTHESELIFWPEYTFVDGKAAKDHLAEIGLYVLQEWYDTGTYVEKNLSIRLAYAGEITTKINDDCYAVCDFDGNRGVQNDITKLKNNPKSKSDKIEKLQKEQRLAAWKVWNG